MRNRLPRGSSSPLLHTQGEGEGRGNRFRVRSKINRRNHIRGDFDFPSSPLGSISSVDKISKKKRKGKEEMSALPATEAGRRRATKLIRSRRENIKEKKEKEKEKPWKYLPSD